MKKPTIGQVLAAKNGQQFVVTDVYALAAEDDPDFSPDEYSVAVAPYGGIGVQTSEAFEEDMFAEEFEAWCKRHEISY